MKYRLIRMRLGDDFEQAVNLALVQGWELYGPPYFRLIQPVFDGEPVRDGAYTEAIQALVMDRK